MFTFYSDYHRITGKSHGWAAKITGNTNFCRQPLGGRHHGGHLHRNIKAPFGRKSAGFEQLEKYHRSYEKSNTVGEGFEHKTLKNI